MERQDHRQDAPSSIGPTDDIFATARRRLLRQALVFEDPAAYAAGVEDALATVAAMTSRPRTEPAAGRSVHRTISDGDRAVTGVPAAAPRVTNDLSSGALR